MSILMFLFLANAPLNTVGFVLPHLLVPAPYPFATVGAITSAVASLPEEQ